jgi:anti-anti-sigma factor
MMDITVHFDDAIPVLTLNGRLDGFGASLLNDRSAQLGDEVTHIIIDLAGVDYVSSVGIRSLVALEKKLRSRDGRAVLVGLSAAVAQVLEMAGLLKEFRTSESLPEAVRWVRLETVSQQAATHRQVNGRDYVLRPNPEAGCVLDVWGSFSDLSAVGLQAEHLAAVTLEELELAFGVGGFGGTRLQASEALGEFISLGRFAGVVPADGHCFPDFVLSDKPSDSLVYVAAAVGLSGKPWAVLEAKSGNAFTVADLMKDIFQLSQAILTSSPPLIGLIVIAETPGFVGAHFETLEDIPTPRNAVKKPRESKAALILGVAANTAAVQSSGDPTVSTFSRQLSEYPLESRSAFHGHAVLLTAAKIREAQLDPGESIRAIANLENFQGVAHVESETLLSNPRIWLYAPSTVRSGVEKRLKVVIEEGMDSPGELNVIVRRLYTDASRVVLTPLHGGFMSKTFSVVSYDNEGRRLLPTVLKTGSVSLTNREAEAYHHYVQKFILNNSTTIMGMASHGDWAGLRYNFLGITGTNTKLTWLEKHYVRRPVEELLPLLDKIYTDILKPWYGQPKWDILRPYAEHSPFRLFPNILEDAQKELGISADEPTLDCPELNRRLPNPFHFLKHEYSRRAAFTLPWYQSPVHGDLNMKNILVDDNENVYIIDFSETRMSNVVSDFARLEPIVKFELTRLETEHDLKELVEFEAGLAQVGSLRERPPFSYHGSDAMVEKAYRVIHRLRDYADIATLFESDIVPYLLAILEWTLPVVSYRGISTLRKRLAAYSAGLVCRKILELESAQGS